MIHFHIMLSNVFIVVALLNIKVDSPLQNIFLTQQLFPTNYLELWNCTYSLNMLDGQKAKSGQTKNKKNPRQSFIPAACPANLGHLLFCSHRSM